MIHTDDFASWDDAVHWWPLVIERVFEPIMAGARTLSYPRSSWGVDHQPQPVVEQPVTDTIILEGVTSSRSEFRTYLSLSIFVDLPRDECLRRGIERDRATGKTEAELHSLWEAWMVEEDEYMRRDRPREHADIVIDGARRYEDQIALD